MENLDYIEAAGLNGPTKGRQHVEFYLRPIFMKAKSEAAGYPIHESVEYIKIFNPGGKDIVDREVTEEHRSIYAAQYAKFKAGDATQIVGFPIEQWPGIDVAQAADLKHSHIFTVEQLAEVPDSNLAPLGPRARSLREKAKAYLEAAKGNAPLQKLSDENERLKGEVEILKQQIAEISDRVKGEEGGEKVLAEAEQAAQPKPKRKRGRPRKKPLVETA